MMTELRKFPNDFKVNFWCADGFVDTVNAIYNQNDKIIITGCNVNRPNFSINYPNVKLYNDE